MDQPDEIKQAVIALWVTLAISALLEVINVQMGTISQSEFMGNIFIYAIFCMVPYKINKGSNPARHVYAVITAVGILFLLGGGYKQIPTLSLVGSIVMTPAYIFIIYRLFSGSAKIWFSQRN